MATTPEQFSERVDRLRGALVEQGRRVQAQCEVAFGAVFGCDLAMAKDACLRDDEIDRVDVELEQAAVALLADATREGAQLDAGQLRWVLTIVKINNELERIADAAVDVAEMVQPLRSIAPQFPPTFRVMANSVVGILRDVNNAIARADPALSKVVLQSQHAVTEFKGAILRDAENRIAKGTMSVEMAFRLHEIGSQCELMADHCTNISEQIIYVTTGAIVRHTEARWIEVPGGRS